MDKIDSTVSKLLGEIKFPFVKLVEISKLEKQLSVRRQTAFKFLRVLHIPVISFGDGRYYSEIELAKAVYYVTRTGQQDFAAPGTKIKGSVKYRPEMKRELTVGDIEEINNPDILALMVADSGQSKNINMEALLKAVKGARLKYGRKPNTTSKSTG